MKFSIKKNVLLPVLGNIQGITNRKTNLAITTSVLIKSGKSGIYIAATDLETGVEGFYPASVESEGSIAINALKTYEIIRDFPSDEILLDEVENYWIKIGQGKVKYHIMGMNPQDFPSIPKIEDVTFFEIDSGILKSMIEKTIIITPPPEDKRAHVVGNFLLISVTDKTQKVAMISTDGSRLSIVEHDYDNSHQLPFEGDTGVLIAKRAFGDVAKFLSAVGKVGIGLKDNHFILKKNSETIIIRLMEGKFPNYSRILSGKQNEASVNLKMNRHSFMLMLKRMSILATERYRGVIFKFDDNRLAVVSTNPEIGDSKEDMDIDYQGPSLEMAFNPKYFLDTLNSIEDDEIILNLIDNDKPCLLEGTEDKSYLTAIMPMKI